MLTAEKLEKIIELEDKLKSEYQAQIDVKSTEIEGLLNKQEEQQAVIDKQLAKLAEMPTAASASKRLEQLNREMTHRCEKLEEEVTTQKKRLKGLQKDLAEERAEVKSLRQYDAAALKKNLDASKKKLKEKSEANDLLQKSVNKYRTENVELQQKVKELEEKLAQFESAEVSEEPEEAEAAAA